MSDHTALLNRIRQVSALAPFNQWLDLRVEQAERRARRLERRERGTVRGR